MGKNSRFRGVCVSGGPLLGWKRAFGGLEERGFAFEGGFADIVTPLKGTILSRKFAMRCWRPLKEKKGCCKGATAQWFVP